MLYRIAALLSHPLLAETNAERRGKLLGLLLGSIVIMIVGFVLVRKNRNKE